MLLVLFVRELREEHVVESKLVAGPALDGLGCGECHYRNVLTMSLVS